MADFGVWVAAAEPALQSAQVPFMVAYTRNRGEANELAFEASVLTPYLLEVAAGAFEGTASELLQRLDTKAPEKVRKQRSWPKNGRSLSGKLRRLAPNFREVGIEIEFIRTTGQGSRRLIRVATRRNTCDADNICDALEALRNGDCVASVAKKHIVDVELKPTQSSITDSLDPVPAPTDKRVRCRDCTHFVPDEAGCNDIGQCAVEGEGTKPTALPLFPGSLRNCRDFAAVPQGHGVEDGNEKAPQA